MVFHCLVNNLPFFCPSPKINNKALQDWNISYLFLNLKKSSHRPLWLSNKVSKIFSLVIVRTVCTNSCKEIWFPTCKIFPTESIFHKKLLFIFFFCQVRLYQYSGHNDAFDSCISQSVAIRYRRYFRHWKYLLGYENRYCIIILILQNNIILKWEIKVYDFLFPF